jgi:uncharacterized coiled-coil DUF342 family protein
MYHKRHNISRSTQQTQQDICARLREYRQQLAVWQRELEDIEQRVAALRERQQALQTQLEIVQQKKQYLFQLMEEYERRTQA